MLKQMVIENGWSGFNLTVPGFGGTVGGVYFKSVDYELTPDKLNANDRIKSIWVYSCPLKGRWTKILNKDIAG